MDKEIICPMLSTNTVVQKDEHTSVGTQPVYSKKRKRGRVRMFEENFTLIHCHSCHSVKDSPLQIRDMVARAKALGVQNLTLTDHGTGTGLIEFMDACQAQGINGIPGCEFYLETSAAPHAHLVVFAKDWDGYVQICRALTQGNRHLVSIGGIQSPLLTLDDLKALFPGGHVYATTACINGPVACILREGSLVDAEIAKLKRRQAKCQNPDDPVYLAQAAKMRQTEEDIAAMLARKEALSRTAKRTFGQKEKGLRALSDRPAVYRDAQQALLREKEETERAKEETASLTKKIASLKHTRTALRTRMRSAEQTHERYRALAKQIDEAEERRLTRKEREQKAADMLDDLHDIFGEGLFVELQNHGLPEEKEVMPVLAHLAKRAHIRVSAANDSHIATADQAETRRDLKALRFHKVEPLSDADCQLYMKSADELYLALCGVVDEDTARHAMENTNAVGASCRVQLPGNLVYPRYRDADGVVVPDAPALLRQRAEEGIAGRFPNGFPAAYRKRMEDELQVIIDLGYADYLLIVADFIRYAREYSRQHDPSGIGYGIGPGRGSGAGSLVNYLLGTTNIDPMRYGLLFERFLNKDRVSMPDIDTDFSAEVREPTIDYVKRKYGVDCVACIRTSITMGAKAAVRNMARILGWEKYGGAQDVTSDSAFAEDGGADETDKAVDPAVQEKGMARLRALGDAICRQIPQKPDISLKDCLPELQSAFGGQADAMTIMTWAMDLEGVIVGTSIHAAGVIIGTGTPLTDLVPLYYNTSKERWAVQCDMVEAEHDLHLLKMDFLGLNNLDIITDAIRTIWRTHGVRIDPDDLPLDPRVFGEIFCKGNTSCVFQFESPGMKQMLRDFRPATFEDLILLVAAYRPGPMEFIPDIIAVKKGKKKPKYIVPELKRILSVTYGQPIYQEQLMDIFHTCADFTLGEADIIRRHMSKKHVSEFLAYKPQFIRGVMKKGADQTGAEQLWDSLTGFARYGFNKSHAAAYAHLSYITAYLKLYYPAEYMCAVLNHAKTDKIPALLYECRRMGITICLPDVNRSQSAYTTADGRIRFGLKSIKGMDSRSVDMILTERRQAGRGYGGLADFLDRTECRAGAAEKLIAAGALDAVGTRPRADLILMLPKLTAALEKQKAKKKLVEDLTNQLQDANAKDRKKLERRIVQAEEAVTKAKALQQEADRLHEEEPDLDGQLRKEHELLGAYVSAHPMDGYEDLYQSGRVRHIADFVLGYDTYAGVISNLRITHRKADGAEMAFFQIEDASGVIQVNCFAKTYAECRACIAEGRIVQIRGRGTEETEGEGDDQTVVQELTAQTVLPCIRRRTPALVFCEDEAERAALMETVRADSGRQDQERPLWIFLKKRNGERYGRIEDTGAELHESLIEKEPIPDSWQYRHVLKAGSRTLHVVLVNMGNRKPDMDT